MQIIVLRRFQGPQTLSLTVRENHWTNVFLRHFLIVSIVTTVVKIRLLFLHTPYISRLQ